MNTTIVLLKEIECKTNYCLKFKNFKLKSLDRMATKFSGPKAQLLNT